MSTTWSSILYIDWDEIAELSSDSENEDAETDVEVDYEILRKLCIGKICVATRQSKDIAVLSNNSLFAASVDVNDKKSEMTKQKHICRAGHRSDVRALCFSNDGSAIASASGEELKIWNRDSLKCIRTMACGYALSCSFLPGDRHVVVGTKSGTLQLFDLASSSLLEEIEGHTAALWSLCVLPDKRGIVTGSADKTVRFWQFELISDDNEEGDDSKKEIVSENRPAGKRLTLVATRVLQMSDDVLCVKVSADNRLLAVSLLDHTIKVFFVDTLKFFLSLYGHSLPALAIDISTDGTLLISGSADKNIKIWGLDFGDCHKSLFAHDDSVMGLTFTPKTHFFFSCGKDGAVKQWDADTFSHITTLKPPHHGEVWSVASSPSGMSLVTSSHDKSIRVWEKTEEVLVLEEEKEIEREMQFDKELEQEENPVVPGEATEEVGFANRKTIESVKGTERIIEAVELWRSEKDKIVKNQDELHPLLRAFNCKTPKDYLLEVLKKIKPSELEESLLVMPFDFATDLLTILELLLGEQKSLELVCKCQLFLMRVHHNQITSNQMLLPTMERLRQSSTKTVEHYKDRIGFNLTALQLLQLRLEEQQADELFTDATALFKKKEKRRKNKHKPA